MPFRKEIAGGNIFGVLCTVFASVVINIETENMKAQQVRLRALEPEDIVFLYRWENDPAVWTVSNTITPYSKYVLKKYIDSSHLDIYTTKQQRFVIVHTETDIPIGTVDLFDFEPSDRRAGLGILIYDEKDRGKGFASQAVDLLLEYCFGTLGLHQVYCNIFSDNEASLRLFASKGFVRAGVKKEWVRAGNRWKDEVLMQLINPEG